MEIIIACIIGYLIGSIPWALVIGKTFYHTDIRQHGSGNLGGSNAGRVLGKTAGVSVSVLDAVKSVLAMVVVFLYQPNLIGLAGFMAAIGHCFPLYANFKGGKAVASIIGFQLGLGLFHLIPIWVFVVTLVGFFGLLKLTKTVSLSSITAIALGLVSAMVLRVETMYLIYLGFLWILTVVRHKENIKRVLKKEERKITWM